VFSNQKCYGMECALAHTGPASALCRYINKPSACLIFWPSLILEDWVLLESDSYLEEQGI